MGTVTKVGESFLISPYRYQTGDHIYWLQEEPDEHGMELLDEALEYENQWVFKLDGSHWKHLVRELNITQSDEEPTSYTFFIDLAMGYLSACKEEGSAGSWFMVLNVPDNGYTNIHTVLLDKLMETPTLFAHKGLKHLLDSNYGGEISNQTLDIAGMIMWG